MLNESDRNRFPISSSSDAAATFIAFGVDPGYSIDDNQRSHIVPHCTATLGQSAFAIGSSFFAAPGHRPFVPFAFLDCLGLDFVTGTATKVDFFDETIRSMCR